MRPPASSSTVRRTTPGGSRLMNASVDIFILRPSASGEFVLTAQGVQGSRPIRRNSPSTPPIEGALARSGCAPTSTNASPGNQRGPRQGFSNMRWIGSLVAESLRILMRGRGYFLYPADARPGYREGPAFVLLYEAHPMALVMEWAGAAAAIDRTPAKSSSSGGERRRTQTGGRWSCWVVAAGVGRTVGRRFTRASSRCSTIATHRCSRGRGLFPLTVTPHVAQPSHHIDYGFIGRRYDIGEKDVRKTSSAAKKVAAGLHRRRRLPPLQSRPRWRTKMVGGKPSAGNKHFQPIFSPRNQPVRGAGADVFATMANPAPARPRALRA